MQHPHPVFLRDEARLPPAHMPTEATACHTHLFPKAHLFLAASARRGAGCSARPGVHPMEAAPRPSVSVAGAGAGPTTSLQLPDCPRLGPAVPPRVLLEETRRGLLGCPLTAARSGQLQAEHQLWRSKSQECILVLTEALPKPVLQGPPGVQEGVLARGQMP